MRNIILNILENMVNDTTLVIIAMVAALGLLGLVVVETISVKQQVEATKSATGTCASRVAKEFMNSSTSYCHL